MKSKDGENVSCETRESRKDEVSSLWSLSMYVLVEIVICLVTIFPKCLYSKYLFQTSTAFAVIHVHFRRLDLSFPFDDAKVWGKCAGFVRSKIFSLKNYFFPEFL